MSVIDFYTGKKINDSEYMHDISTAKVIIYDSGGLYEIDHHLEDKIELIQYLRLVAKALKMQTSNRNS